MTTVEVFQGTGVQLKARIDVLIATPKVIDQIIVCAEKSYYLICYH